MKPFSIVVAFDSKYGIGKNGQLAWHLPADLKHFKTITSTVTNPTRKNAVIMGRKTWESIPQKFRPLANRINVVLSKGGNLNLPVGVLAAASIDEALSKLSSSDIERIFIIGGAQIYNEAINHPSCERLYVTHVQGENGCDTFFPPIAKQFFPISASEHFKEGDFTFQFAEYIRQQ